MQSEDESESVMKKKPVASAIKQNWGSVSLPSVPPYRWLHQPVDSRAAAVWMWKMKNVSPPWSQTEHQGESLLGSPLAGMLGEPNKKLKQPKLLIVKEKCVYLIQDLQNDVFCNFF